MKIGKSWTGAAYKPVAGQLYHTWEAHRDVTTPLIAYDVIRYLPGKFYVRFWCEPGAVAYLVFYPTYKEAAAVRKGLEELLCTVGGCTAVKRPLPRRKP